MYLASSDSLRETERERENHHWIDRRDQRSETKAGWPRSRRESYGRAGWVLRIQIDTTDRAFFTDMEYNCFFCVFGALRWVLSSSPPPTVFYALSLYTGLFHCPDDHVLQRHIHLIPPQYLDRGKDPWRPWLSFRQQCMNSIRFFFNRPMVANSGQRLFCDDALLKFCEWKAVFSV
jgi:hypothetical protein